MEFMLCAGRTDAARTSAQAAQKELAIQRLASEPLNSKFKIIHTKTLAFFVCMIFCLRAYTCNLKCSPSSAQLH
jgi:hypothetical protein